MGAVLDKVDLERRLDRLERVVEGYARVVPALGFASSEVRELVSEIRAEHREPDAVAE